MRPAEFIESLHRHYSKRHNSQADQEAWITEMIGCVGGTDPKVLRRAYEMIRDEHDERAFPLPAVLKKYIARAAEQLFPDDARNTGSVEYKWPMPKTYKCPQFERTCREAQEWQTKIINQYGSWAGYWKAMGHTYTVGTRKAPVARATPAVPASIRLALPLANVRRKRLPRKTFNVARPAMLKLQQSSKNAHLHMTQAAYMRRITGDRT